MHGHGTMKSPNGSLYTGIWINNKRNRKGTYLFSNGNKYMEIVEGKKHGKGKFIKKDGDIYDGDWFRDKKHGNGKFISEHNNYVYDGQWYEDNLMVVEKLIIKMVIPMTVNGKIIRDMEKVHLHVQMEINT